MKLIFVSDIFGLTASLVELVNGIVLQNFEYQIIDPYAGEIKQFEDEKLAYAAFQASGGMQGYIQKLNSFILSYAPVDMIIGFSAGGAAAWKAIQNIDDKIVGRLIAFYPGQIRHFLDVTPVIPCELIFPESEAHFDVHEVIKILQPISSVSCERTIWQHGFMNPLSSGFDQDGRHNFSERIRLQLLAEVKC